MSTRTHLVLFEEARPQERPGSGAGIGEYLVYVSAVAGLLVTAVLPSVATAAPIPKQPEDLAAALLQVDRIRQNLAAPSSCDPKRREDAPKEWSQAWQRVVATSTSVAAWRNDPVLRAIVGHAKLALNENNESLQLLASLAPEPAKTAWAQWTTSFASAHLDSITAQYLAGDASARAGDRPRAFRILSAAIDRHAGIEPKPIGLALAYNARGVLELLEIPPNSPTSLETMAPETDLRASCELAPWLADVRASRGLFHVAVGSYGAAIPEYEMSLQLSPQSALAKNGLACALLLRSHNDTRRATALLQECVTDPVVGRTAQANLEAQKTLQTEVADRKSASPRPGQTGRLSEAEKDRAAHELADKFVKGKQGDVTNEFRKLERQGGKDYAHEIYDRAKPEIGFRANATGQAAEGYAFQGGQRGREGAELRKYAANEGMAGEALELGGNIGTLLGVEPGGEVAAAAGKLLKDEAGRKKADAQLPESKAEDSFREAKKRADQRQQINRNGDQASKLGYGDWRAPSKNQESFPKSADKYTDRQDGLRSKADDSKGIFEPLKGDKGKFNPSERRPTLCP